MAPETCTTDQRIPERRDRGDWWNSERLNQWDPTHPAAAWAAHLLREAGSIRLPCPRCNMVASVRTNLNHLLRDHQTGYAEVATWLEEAGADLFSLAVHYLAAKARSSPQMARGTEVLRPRRRTAEDNPLARHAVKKKRGSGSTSRSTADPAGGALNSQVGTLEAEVARLRHALVDQSTQLTRLNDSNQQRNRSTIGEIDTRFGGRSAAIEDELQGLRQEVRRLRSATGALLIGPTVPGVQAPVVFRSEVICA